MLTGLEPSAQGHAGLARSSVRRTHRVDPLEVDDVDGNVGHLVRHSDLKEARKTSFFVALLDSQTPYKMQSTHSFLVNLHNYRRRTFV